MSAAPRTAQITITLTERKGTPKPHLVRVRARDPWPGDKLELSVSFRVKTQAQAYKRRLDEALGDGERIDPATLRPYSWAPQAAAVTWVESLIESFNHFKDGWDPGTRKINADTYGFLATCFGGLPPADSSVTADAVRRAITRACHYGSLEYTPSSTDSLVRHRRVVCSPDEIAEALKWVREHSQPVAGLDHIQLEQALKAVSLKLNGLPYANGGKKQRRAAMHKIFDRIVFLGHLSDNPVKKVKIQRKKSESRRTIKQVTKEQVLELDEILHALRTATDLGGVPAACMVIFALCGLAGVRPGEALEALWSKTHLPERDEVEVDEHGRELGRAFGVMEIATSRTEHGEWADEGQDSPHQVPLKHRAEDETRHVMLPPELCDILRLLQARSLPGCDLIAVNEDGDQLTHSQYQGAWQRVRKAAFHGTHEKLVAYDLRHSFISGALRAGYPAGRLADDVGNTVPVLLETYARVMPRDEAFARQALRRMRSVLSSPGPG
ncbi:MAG: hypothetical protein QOD70_1760 [Frankiales bacterium]|nr:hypothetical protein [Frankiales bacterium]